MTEIARILAEGRRSGEKIERYPGPKPANPQEAFAIQTAARGILGWKQRGWKVGCTSEIAQKALGTDSPFPGPVYSERLFKSGDFVPTKPSNWRVTEPEIAFTMASDLPARGRLYDVDDVLAAVASVHPSIECVNPRLPNGFSDPIEWYIADGAVSDALVLGPGIKPLARADYARITTEAKVNGKVISRGVGANALGGPELVLTWLANDLIAKGIHLKAGDIVSTGVITDVFSSQLGDEVIATYDKLGTITMRY
jgi:2-keto-4-pentenoate hydratase